MNLAEATALCRAVRALCPAQSWEAETPALWAEVLADVGISDATATLPVIKRRKPFIDCSDITEEVSRVRKERLKDADDLDVIADGLGDLPGAQYLAALKARRAAVAAGVPVEQARTLAGPPPRYALPAGGEGK